jgi:transposase
MHHCSTLDLGLDVHQEASAVADLAQDHDADVIDLGTLGPRHVDLDHLVRTRPSQAQHLVFVYDAGPCGDWRSRYLRTQGSVCWGVAPSLIPHTAGDRVNTDRRDAVQLARLMRAGDLTPVSVPTVADEAIRDRGRARAAALADLKAANFRLQAVWRRHAIR